MNQNRQIDPTIEEIHRVRREMSEKFAGDFRRMLDDARARQAKSGRPIWRGTTESPVTPNASSTSSDSAAD
jgi:hypothetical protein